MLQKVILLYQILLDIKFFFVHENYFHCTINAFFSSFNKILDKNFKQEPIINQIAKYLYLPHKRKLNMLCIAFISFFSTRMILCFF